MEFFAEIPDPDTSIDHIRQTVTIERLPDLCASIESVLSSTPDGYGEIYCVWGRFRVAREPIHNGVRFSLLNCPHALAWTVALHENPRALVVHCTIDDKAVEQEFAESIEQFVADFAQGLGDNPLRSA
ncbi:hypothetical protein [Acidihalobacter prosperus]|uniref:Uncharacterized protein n=1 Tax=Acidihalobacter prosperus TaxID=160660 RepID=A0A1A6C2C0_9GAMM|nr:hypothetical protein [Acidihalobacter prosperus]OBS08695.1 hypothetical protein Thpro_022945 [Acidihalobacter prosperus]